jgi:hypothetical protein
MINSTILEVLNLKWNVKASVIGYWRMGATAFEIHIVTGLNYTVIMQIILDYEKTNKGLLCQKKVFKMVG